MTDVIPPLSPAGVANAEIDITRLGQWANGAADVNGTGLVTMRLGGQVRTPAKIDSDLAAVQAGLTGVLAGVSAQQANIDGLVAALSPGGTLYRVVAGMDSLVAASGLYPAPLGAHDALAGTVITDPRDTVSREEVRGGLTLSVRYRPRSLPFTVGAVFDPEDWFEIPAGAVLSSIETALTTAMRRIARLARLFPAVAPRWSPLPYLSIEEGTVGEVFDFGPYIDDPDSLAAELGITLSEPLPDGLYVDGLKLMANNPPVAADHLYGFIVTDEALEAHGATTRIQIYPVGMMPSVPPVFMSLPDIEVPRGSPVPPRAHVLDLFDSDTDPGALSVAGSVGPAGSGMTLTAGVRGGRAETIGTYVVTLSGSDGVNAPAAGSYQLVVTDPPPPVLDALPWNGSRTVGVNAEPQLTNLADYFTSSTTPDAEFITPLSPYGAPPVLSDAPPGTSLTGLLLTLPTNTVGNFRPRIILTDRAGKTVTIEFDFIVNPQYTPGGGGSGQWDQVIF